jgi:tetraacyldisaccharide 4'-kinase
MRYLERHWQSTTFMTLLLWPLAGLYCAIVALRRALYRLGLLTSIQLPVPVVIVGNITVGGTGKTPIVIALAKQLAAAGLRPGVITRGYRGRGTTWPVLVQADMDTDEVGDEAVLLARHCPGPVAAGPDRVAAARLILAQHPCDVIISDDGLQHYRLRRDIEIAVIDGARRFGNASCLPAGPLREPISRLRKVDIVITNGSPRAGEWGAQLQPRAFVDVRTGRQRVAADHFDGRVVHAVAGIGHPQRFFTLLAALGVVAHPHPFPDHYRFSREALRFPPGTAVIMTEKDAVKCRHFADRDWWYLAVEAELDSRLMDALTKSVQEKVHG